MKDEDLAKQLWVLGDIVRLRLLRSLPTQPDCDHGNNVSRLAEKLGLSQPTVSHHLRILRQAGFVENRKMCRDVYYWIHADAIHQVQAALEALLPENSVED